MGLAPFPLSQFSPGSKKAGRDEGPHPYENNLERCRADNTPSLPQNSERTTEYDPLKKGHQDNWKPCRHRLYLTNL